MTHHLSGLPRADAQAAALDHTTTEPRKTRKVTP